MENIDKIANIDAIVNAIKDNSEDGFFLFLGLVRTIIKRN